MPEPDNRLRTRIARFIAGSRWPQPPKVTSAIGISDQALENLAMPFFQVSRVRNDTYKDVVEMDSTVDEVATALDMLADNSVSAEYGTQKAFFIAYEKTVSEEIKALIEALIERTQLQEKQYEIARSSLLYGDDFRQPVMDPNFNIVRLMYMPPESMIRNEDPQGLLMTGDKEGLWAFEQVYPNSRQFIAGFYPFQMVHLRWNKSGKSPYGRSLLYTARTSWKKLQAMEEALVINWITRAFARLLFVLDVTNKSDKEAELAISDFKRSLQTRRIAKDVEGVEQLSVVKDIFLGNSIRMMGGKAVPGLTDVRVLDTSSSGFQNLNAIDYYRSKIIMSLRTPKAYLGLEEDINAKATLIQQDRRYAKFLQRIQQFLTQGIAKVIDLQLSLYGIDPKTVPYIISWPLPAWSDRLEDSEAALNYAQADEIYLGMGVVDEMFIGVRHVGMSLVDYEAVQQRIGKDANGRSQQRANSQGSKRDKPAS